MATENKYHLYLRKKGIKPTDFHDFARGVINSDKVFKSKFRHENKEYKVKMGPGSAGLRRWKNRRDEALKNKMK